MNTTEYPTNWQHQSIEFLEDEDWGLADDASHLIATCHRLRKKPIHTFEIEDLRIMIGQGIGLPYLIPLALEKLALNPLAEGDFYPGDLLKNVLDTNSLFWKDALDFFNQLSQIVDQNKEKLEKEDHNFIDLFKELQTEVNGQ
jgi:hypothetical protein